jgi:acyl-homoserine-lactone acylase
MAALRWADPLNEGSVANWYSGNLKTTMRFLILPFFAFTLLAFQPDAKELARLESIAAQVKIVRDDWGIAHVSAKTDAAAVFGMIYAQAEDDFNRIEVNYLTSLGRSAEAEGESKVIQDLRMRLFIEPEALKKLYSTSPLWLQKLMNAWADGLNFYLAKHPNVKARVLTRFEPWMALSFSEGSIGGDIERINLAQLEALYAKSPASLARLQAALLAEANAPIPEPAGSNGIAIAPSRSASGHPLLLINPHTTFHFRSELQMSSQEGLNAYGAVTWGQFFIYQGFNDKAGWMHTSSGVDVIDEYVETISSKDGKYFYQYGREQRPVEVSNIRIPYKTASGKAEKQFTVYRTHHGPVVREANGKWIAVRLMQEPVKALQQSYLRTKARNYAAYKQSMELKANSSNNTIYADAQGTIAYFHGNYIPRRDRQYDWTQPVNGADPETDYKGLHSLDEIPQLLNPPVGWLYNANNSPWSAAGPDSPKKENFPAYVESGRESARGLHALRVLNPAKNMTIPSLLAAAYDSYLPWFERTIPALLKAAESAPNPVKTRLAEPLSLLRNWDLRWSTNSIPTALAVFFGEEAMRKSRPAAQRANLSIEDYLASQAPPDVLLEAMSAALDRLERDFGTWRTPWGEINRLQRITGDIVQPFSDAAPSLPIGFTSGNFGSLASFGARAYPGTKKWYGTSGNSFVAVVEFGPRVKAIAISVGGESGNVSSKHFNDQAERYSKGALREVYFYRDQLKAHTEREYQPGK